MAYGKDDSKNLQTLFEKANKVLAKDKESKQKTLADGARATQVAQVVRHEGEILVPDSMSLPQVVTVLLDRIEYEEKAVILKEQLDVFPYDGALALDNVLTEIYGWSQSTGTPTWFGEVPPSLINIATGPHTFVKAPWGQFKLPGVEGNIAASTEFKNGRYTFKMVANIKRKDEASVQNVFNQVREYLKLNSIYRGKAIKMKFTDEDGAPLPMPEPEFIDTDVISPDQLIFSDDVMASIETNLFTPIKRVRDCLDNGIPVKRGILLGGTYGTGKTLAASVASWYAVQAGVTYVYIPKASDLAAAIEFAKQYQSPACVIFCEDIDRVMSGERDEATDEILNLIDGIDTKNANIIVVLTTNALENIEPAMLRPGRLDAVIDVSPPDGKAAGRLLRFYGKGAIKPETDLTAAGDLLSGSIPAIIAEVVVRAKLSQLTLNPPGVPVTDLSEAALVEASRTMQMQTKLLESKLHPQPKSDGLSMEEMIGVVVESQLTGVNTAQEAMLREVQSLGKAIAKIKAATGA